MKNKLLVIQSNKAASDHIIPVLDSYQVNVIPDLISAGLSMQEESFGVVISEWQAFGKNIEYFREWIGNPSLSMVPFIILAESGIPSQERIDIIRSGADYVFIAPVDAEELSASVDRLLQRSKQFEQIAFCDGLTGVFNRRYFDQQLRMEMDRSKRNGSLLSLALIDIDRFKQINDTYGHPFGDLVLQGLGKFLSKNVRSTDFLARLGGEEFAILFPDTPEQLAGEVMVQVLQTINVTSIAELNGNPFYITFSGGVVQYGADMTPKQLLEGADEGLYRAKQNGRNRIELAHGRLAGDEKERNIEVKHVLIVDDSEQERLALATALEVEALKIRTAVSAEDALELITKQSFDLCIIDDVMPRVDGMTLMKKIKMNPDTKSIKIIMLQSKGKSSDMIRYLNAGADDCLAKPVSPFELEYRVKYILEI